MGKPLTHRRLLQSVWGPDYGEETENLRVVINHCARRLRPILRAQRYFDGTVDWVPLPAATAEYGENSFAKVVVCVAPPGKSQH